MLVGCCVYHVSYTLLADLQFLSQSINQSSLLNLIDWLTEMNGSVSLESMLSVRCLTCSVTCMGNESRGIIQTFIHRNKRQQRDRRTDIYKDDKKQVTVSYITLAKWLTTSLWLWCKLVTRLFTSIYTRMGMKMCRYR